MNPAAKVRTIHLRVSEVLYERLEGEAHRLGMMTTETARYAILKYFVELDREKEVAKKEVIDLES